MKTKKPYQISICEKSFGQKTSLKQYIDTVHEDKKPFQCGICQQSFGQKGGLKCHINLVHEKIS